MNAFNNEHLGDRGAKLDFPHDLRRIEHGFSHDPLLQAVRAKALLDQEEALNPTNPLKPTDALEKVSERLRIEAQNIKTNEDLSNGESLMRLLQIYSNEAAYGEAYFSTEEGLTRYRGRCANVIAEVLNIEGEKLFAHYIALINDNVQGLQKEGKVLKGATMAYRVSLRNILGKDAVSQLLQSKDVPYVFVEEDKKEAEAGQKAIRHIVKRYMHGPYANTIVDADKFNTNLGELRKNIRIDSMNDIHIQALITELITRSAPLFTKAPAHEAARARVLIRSYVVNLKAHNSANVERFQRELHVLARNNLEPVVQPKITEIPPAEDLAEKQNLHDKVIKILADLTAELSNERNSQHNTNDRDQRFAGTTLMLGDTPLQPSFITESAYIKLQNDAARPVNEEYIRNELVGHITDAQEQTEPIKQLSTLITGIGVIIKAINIEYSTANDRTQMIGILQRLIERSTIVGPLQLHIAQWLNNRRESPIANFQSRMAYTNGVFECQRIENESSELGELPTEQVEQIEEPVIQILENPIPDHYLTLNTELQMPSRTPAVPRMHGSSDGPRQRALATGAAVAAALFLGGCGPKASSTNPLETATINMSPTQAKSDTSFYYEEPSSHQDDIPPSHTPTPSIPPKLATTAPQTPKKSIMGFLSSFFGRGTHDNKKKVA